jgi:SNF2 family DNA or RNA helicase
MGSVTIKVMAGKYWREITLIPDTHNRIRLKFDYPTYMALKDEIKSLQGARWHSDGKYWTITNSSRNKFALEYLAGKDPYKRFSEEVPPLKTRRKEAMKHQQDMFAFSMARKQCILAAEPGVGKTLVAIEVMEAIRSYNVLWVGPKSGLRAVEMELLKWESLVWPTFSTYDSLKKLTDKTFDVAVFDESQKLKNPMTQRFEAAVAITELMRKKNPDPIILLLTGTPSPNAPTDWWSQVELVCPGYLREGNLEKFKRRMALIIQRESMAGAAFPELVTWWDNTNKCKICGKLKEDLAHDMEEALSLGYEYHEFVLSVNEVEGLYRKLKGIVHIVFKKDVLDLPDKTFEIIRCRPTQEILRAARLIVAKAKNAVTAAILLRELSDGFQYQEIEIGTKVCDLCKGKGTIEHPNLKSEFGEYEECPSCGGHIEGYKCVSCDFEIKEEIYEDQDFTCPNCGGSGEVEKMAREARQVPCPKEDILREKLEEYEDIGRVVIFAGFQGSVDRCVQICRSMDWHTIRVDGRGWTSSIGPIRDTSMLREFQDKSRKYQKIAFVAQPDSGGVALTLTESPVAIFYSNSIMGSSRMQAIERIHRPGMDYNLGAKIIDFIHLPTDEKQLDTLNKKKRLQDMSLGDFSKALEDV